MRRSLARLVCAGLLAFGVGGCGAPEVRRETARLDVQVEPTSARITVDDRFVATGRVAAEHPIELAPGPHQVTLEAPGYFPHDLELDLPSGTTTLEVRLRPVPP